jgi:ubiquinone/menaquinone biosynthesis C-methylase UbiE
MGGRDLTSAAMDIFKDLAGSYEQALKVATLLQDRRWKKWLLTRAMIGPGDLVLDLGCGTCLLEEQIGRTGGAAVGLDLSNPMIRMGQAKRLRCVRLLVLGDAVALPFKDSSFDKVVSCYVPKYARMEGFAQEVVRVVRPGGTIVMYDFATPGGIFSPFLAFYIFGVIRLTGVFLGAARRKSASTFRRLPKIIHETTWDSSAVLQFTANGASGGTVERLSWGAAAGFVATKSAVFTDGSRWKEEERVGVDNPPATPSVKPPS